MTTIAVIPSACWRHQGRFGIRLYHYCLMTNHFHALVQLDRLADPSKCFLGISRPYVHHSNRRHGFVGHPRQGRFKSPAIQCVGYLLSRGRDIERDPPEAGMATEPWQYAWSSCRRTPPGPPTLRWRETRTTAGGRLRGVGGSGGFAGSGPVLQPIMPLDLPVKVRSWELTVYPRSHIRRWLGVTRPAKARM